MARANGIDYAVLSRSEVENAVDIQKKSYQLLRWIAEAIDGGVVAPPATHRTHQTPAETAYNWIAEQYMTFPELARPAPNQLRGLANYFGSYLTTSFELVEETSTYLDNMLGGGCYCELCARLVAFSHLRIFKPSKADKLRANSDCSLALQALAAEEGVPLTPEAAASLATEHRRNSAYSAYARALVDRIKGSEGGLHVLALWRMIAWKPTGSPIKGFTLEVEDILGAEKELTSIIVAQAKGGN